MIFSLSCEVCMCPCLVRNMDSQLNTVDVSASEVRGLLRNVVHYSFSFLMNDRDASTSELSTSRINITSCFPFCSLSAAYRVRRVLVASRARLDGARGMFCTNEGHSWKCRTIVFQPSKPVLLASPSLAELVSIHPSRAQSSIGCRLG